MHGTLLIEVLVLVEVVFEVAELAVGEGPPGKNGQTQQHQTQSNNDERSGVDVGGLPDLHSGVGRVDALVLVGELSRLEIGLLEVVGVAFGSHFEQQPVVTDIVDVAGRAVDLGRGQGVVADHELVLVGADEEVILEDELIQQ